MTKKAIKIDLSTFFDDERKMSCVLVDPSWNSVACLQKRVEFLFDVDSVRFLSDGYFLPPQESIEIIKFCNDLKVFVSKESLEKRKKKKSKKCKNTQKSSEESGDEVASPANKQQIDDSQIKRKHNSLASSNPTFILSKKAKRSKNYNTFSEITSTSEPIGPTLPVFDEEVKTKKSKSKKSEVFIATLVHEEPMVENESCKSKSEITIMEKENTTDHVNGDNQQIKCLTSTPKNKITCELEDNRLEKTFSDETKATTARHSSISSSTFLNESKLPEEPNNVNSLTRSPNLNNPFKKPKSCRAHTYFNESGEMVRTPSKTAAKSIPKKDKETKTIVVYRCSLSEVTNGIQSQKPRIFNLKSKNIVNNKTTKEVVEIQEQLILPPIEFATKPKYPTNEKTVINENEYRIQQETNEISKMAEETESLNAERSLNNTSNVTNNVEESSNETTNVTQTQNESQTTLMSMDCVDLSVDVDDEDKTNGHEKLDLTVDDDGNDSSSDIEEISEIIDLNETEDNCNVTINTSKAHFKSINNIRVDKILPFSTDLTDLPKIGDIVIFKIPFTNNKQQPVHTNYMAGKVEYINRRTKSIKILVIDGNTELCRIPNNKFISNLDDSESNTISVQLKLNEMLEPKLFSMD